MQVALSIFGFLRPDLSPWGYGNRCFLVALCHLIGRRLNLEVAIKTLLHQQVKITAVVLMPSSCMDVCRYSYFWWCEYFWCPWLSLDMTNEFLVTITKKFFKDWCLVNSQPTFLFLTYLNLKNYGHIIKSM